MSTISKSSSSYTNLASFKWGSMTASSKVGDTTYGYLRASSITVVIKGYATSFTTSSGTTGTMKGKIAVSATIKGTCNNSASSIPIAGSGEITIPSFRFTFNGTTYQTTEKTVSFSMTATDSTKTIEKTVSLSLSSTTITNTISRPDDTLAFSKPTTANATVTWKSQSKPQGSDSASAGSISNNGVTWGVAATASGLNDITWSAGALTPDSPTMDVTVSHGSFYDGMVYRLFWKAGADTEWNPIGDARQLSKSIPWTIPVTLLTEKLNTAAYLSGDNTSKSATIKFMLRTYVSMNADHAADNTYSKKVIITNTYAPTDVKIKEDASSVPIITDLARSGAGYHVNGVQKFLTQYSMLAFNIDGTLYEAPTTDGDGNTIINQAVGGTIGDASNTGATITSFECAFSDGTSLTLTDDAVVTGNLQTDNPVVSLTITDSRGFYKKIDRSSYITSANTVVYNPPTVAFNTVRADSSGTESTSGTTAKASYTVNYVPVDEQNLSGVIKFTRDDSTELTYTLTGPSTIPFSGTWSDYQLSPADWLGIDASCNVTMSATDAFTTVSGMAGDIKSLKFPLTIGKSGSTISVGIGGLASTSESKFICKLPVMFSGTVVYQDGNPSIGTTTNYINSISLQNSKNSSNDGIVISISSVS